MTTVTTPHTIATVNEHSSPAAVIEAMQHCNESCKRQLQKDPWGRPNADWAACHVYLNQLLDLYQFVMARP